MQNFLHKFNSASSSQLFRVNALVTQVKGYPHEITHIGHDRGYSPSKGEPT